MRECAPPSTCHMSQVTCHLSHFTCHMAPVSCHMWRVIWRVCYQRRLPCIYKIIHQWVFMKHCTSIYVRFNSKEIFWGPNQHIKKARLMLKLGNSLDRLISSQLRDFFKTQFQIGDIDLVQGFTKLITILVTFVTLNKNYANWVDKKWSWIIIFKKSMFLKKMV